MSNGVQSADRASVLTRLTSAFSGAALAQRTDDRRSSDTLSAGIELVLTPALFALLGHLLDRALDTRLLFAVVFAMIALTYEVWRVTTNYNADMDSFESDLPGRDRHRG